MQSFQTTAPDASIDFSVTTKSGIKWNEVLSLGGLNVALAISWIAYLEYQPVLLQKFAVTQLASFLVVAKAIILVVVPILAGWAADRILANRGRFFVVFMIGISTTAMIFMIVASIISMGPEGALAGILPVMIVLWLISMSIFIAPAYSMIERFASGSKLPVVMGVIILVTEVIYALEPLVLQLIHLFGETLTFIVGGVLVLGTGILFQRLTSDEVYERTEMSRKFQGTARNSYFTIAFLGLILGAGRALLVEFVSTEAAVEFLGGKQLSFLLLAVSALVAFTMGRKVSKLGTGKFMPAALITLAISGLISFFGISMTWIFIPAVVITSVSLGLSHLCALPYAFGKLTPKNTTIGIGIFLGASAVAEGLFEIWYAL